MRLVPLLAFFAALAACGAKEETAPAPEDAVAAPGETATGDLTGTYEVKMADGTVMIETINADGTYVDATPEGAETQRGTWRQDGVRMCFDPEGDAPEACYAGGAAGEDGTFQVTDADGKVTSTVRKIEPAAE